MDIKISKNLNIKSYNFWQYYFFLESYTIEVIDMMIAHMGQSISEITCNQTSCNSKNCHVPDNA